MPLTFEGYQTRSQRFQSELAAPVSDVLGATAEQAFTELPIPSMVRAYGLTSAQRSSERLDAETARTRVKDAGLEGRLTIGDDGIAAPALDILIDRKRAEVRRQEVLSRSPGGFGVGAAQLGTAFATSLLDPLNVGLAFVPVIGQARYMRYLASAKGVLGRTAVRAGVGAVEGAAGAAIIEPLVLLAKTQEQADYGFQDSLLNIAFGTVFGGGLHTISGAVADAVRGFKGRTAAQRVDALPPLERDAPMRTAVAHAMEGRVVDVEPLVPLRQTDTPEFRAWFGESKVVDDAGEPLLVFHGTLANIDEFSGAQHFGTAQQAGEIVATREAVNARRAAQGLPPEQVGDPSILPVYLSLKNPKRVEDLGGKSETWAQAIEQAKAEGHDGLVYQNWGEFEAGPDGMPRDSYVAFEPQQVKSATGNSGRFDPSSASLTDARAASDRLASPESDVTADVPAARDADEQLAEQPTTGEPIEQIEAQITDSLAELRDVARVAGIELDKEALAELDELIAKAESYGKAARAAALCGLGH